MLRQKEDKSEKLSAVPVKVEQPSYAVSHAISRISDSVDIAQKQEAHHAHPLHAEHDANLTHKWESVPLVEDAPHFAKKELFKSFKGAVNRVL